MPTLKEAMRGLFSKEQPLQLPEKVTWYGGPEDPYRKVVETYTKDDEGTVHVDRCVQYKMPIDFISVSVKVGEEQKQG